MLYLVQHGLARPKQEDPERRLSEDGRAEVQEIAKLAKERGVFVARIEHSGKARAQETAEIFAKALAPDKGVGTRGGINPNDDVTAEAKDLAPGGNLMLVGHLPFMERLASFLLTGQTEPAIVKFQNGGIVCLDRDDGPWHLKWTLFPRV